MPSAVATWAHAAGAFLHHKTAENNIARFDKLSFLGKSNTGNANVESLTGLSGTRSRVAEFSNSRADASLVEVHKCTQLRGRKVVRVIFSHSEDDFNIISGLLSVENYHVVGFGDSHSS